MSTIEPSGPTPPRPVVIAYRLYIAGAVLGLVGAVVIGALIPASVTSARAQVAEVLKHQGAGSPEQTTNLLIEIAVGVSVTSIVLSIGYAVAMLLLAPRMRRGGNRARVALWVLAAIQVVGVLGSYGVGLVHFVVVAAALVLTALPVSSAWFRSMRPAVPTT